MRKFLIGLGVLLGVLTALTVGGYAVLRRPDLTHAALDAKYGFPDSKFLDVGEGVEAHYRISGNPSGRTLLLVHGFSASLHGWRAWEEILGAEYRIVTVDLPGHGLTRTPKDYAPAIGRYADFIHTFAEKAGLRSYVLVGSSMGGDAAWRAAARRPDAVEALVLIGAAGWSRGESRGGSPLIFTLLENPILGPRLKELDVTPMVRTGLQAAFANPSLADEAMVARYFELSRAPNHRAVLTAISSSPRDYATEEKVGQLKLPTLVLHGEKDAIVPVEFGRRYGAAIPGAKLIAYADLGHLPHEEDPARSAEDLRAFLHGAFPEPPSGAPFLATYP